MTGSDSGQIGDNLLIHNFNLDTSLTSLLAPWQEDVTLLYKHNKVDITHKNMTE